MSLHLRLAIMVNSSHGNPPGSEDPFYGARTLTQTGELMIAVVGAVTGVISLLRSNPWSVGASFAIMAISSAAYIYSRRRQRRQRGQRNIESVPGAPTAFLRGLLPFETGDSLLGRTTELASLVTRVQAAEYRFGYLSAEAGCGKTSLIRSGLVPQLEKLGWLVVYVPRSGPDPRASIARALRRVLDIPANPDAPLKEMITTVMLDSKNSRLIIVCDQFEEFFISQRILADREFFIQEVGRCVTHGEVPVAFLFALRTEFADELQDFGRVIDQPMDKRFAERLRNWDPETAAGFLRAAARHDHVPFAEALITTVVRDLTRAGEVRPVELQVVATRLKEGGVYEVPHYVECGRADGFLAAFVRDVIEPAGAATGELQRQVARHLLRSLCADSRDAKRPSGLSSQELVEYVAAGMEMSGQGNLVPGAQELRSVVDDVLRLCTGSFLVVREDDELYNLAHDYIVRPIREATADLETVEEQANRLADQYLDDQRRNPGQVLPLRHYRFLTKYLSPQRRIDPAYRSLIARSRRRFALVGAGGLASLLAILTLWMPPGTSIRLETSLVSDGEWFTFPNSSLAVRVAEDGTAHAWSTDQHWSTRKALNAMLRDVEISNDGRHVLGLALDGSIHLWRIERGRYRGGRVPVPFELNDETRWRDWGGFSPNGQWVYVIRENGEMYLWHPDEAMSSIDVWANVGSPESYTGPITFDDSGEWLAVKRLRTEGSRSNFVDLYLVPTRERPQNVVPVLTLEATDRRSVPVVFSRDGKWIATAGNDVIHAWKVGERPGPGVRFSGRAYDVDWSLALSRGGRYVVARPVFGNFFQWMPSRMPRGHPRPLFEAPKSGSDGWPNAHFSADEEWVLGVSRHGKLYLWETANSAEGVRQPILATRGDGTTYGVFDPTSSWVLALGSNGGVYTWKLGTRPDVARPLARHDTEEAQLFWSRDGVHVYTLGGSDIYWGKRDRPLERVIRSDSRVIAFRVAENRDAMVIISDRHVTRARRRWSLWGIPLVQLRWPEPAAYEPLHWWKARS